MGKGSGRGYASGQFGGMSVLENSIWQTKKGTMSTLRRDDPEPLYKQVKHHLLEALRSGKIPPNTKLASERELTNSFRVSRITVRQAMRELVMEGYLQSQPGKGFYATGRSNAGFEIELLRSFTETARSHGKKPGSVLLSAETTTPPAPVALLLELGAAQPAMLLHRLRLLDDVPVMISRDWVPVELAPDLLTLNWNLENRSLYDELTTRYGIVPAQGQTMLSARLATPDECQLLVLKAPAALLMVEQVAYSAVGHPINVTYSAQNPSLYPLRLEQAPRS
ncbi:GntR family transcriptional regulator [Devosia rhodophyticola]|uniref:GntR family transcriptional regulator n=1 Tax=Devosia rhodophyticola TaxID=3026423 RepID=A0ABY7YZZ1_9HYPH|nr:GntR family transcriptional regulator [Devosia rhodophyticola]WDR06826.1 GntR family transcriptional regulator [Devosia rhodophyticola]